MYKIITAIILCGSFYSIYTDISMQQPVPLDLRNRVVGSRMIKDGLSPYYYKWQTGDSVRYYDALSISMPYKISASTATPFFHRLIYPVAALPQVQINILWLIIEYLAIVLSVWFIIAATDSPVRINVLLAAIAIGFTYTFGWRLHAMNGQSYILIAFFASGSYYFYKNQQTIFHLLSGGIFAAMLILIKPTTALILLPFLFFPKQYFRQVVSVFAILAIYVLFVFCTPVERLNWQEYFNSIRIHAMLHKESVQHVENASIDSLRITTPLPSPLRHFEGVDIVPLPGKIPTIAAGENESFLFLWYRMTRKATNNTFLSTVCLGMLFVLLFPMFFVWKKQKKITLEQLMILGFCLYKTLEFFAPIIVFTYQWASWLFPLLLLGTSSKKLISWPVLLAFIGFIPQIILMPILKIPQTVGLTFMIIGFLIFTYKMLMPDKIGGIATG